MGKNWHQKEPFPEKSLHAFANCFQHRASLSVLTFLPCPMQCTHMLAILVTYGHCLALFPMPEASPVFGMILIHDGVSAVFLLW